MGGRRAQQGTCSWSFALALSSCRFKIFLTFFPSFIFAFGVSITMTFCFCKAKEEGNAAGSPVWDLPSATKDQTGAW